MCGSRRSPLVQALPSEQVTPPGRLPRSGPGPSDPVPSDPIPSDARTARLRIGDAERDATVELLGTAFAEGYLDSRELETRTERALAATTGSELGELRRDLPARLDPAVTTAARARVESARRGARAHVTSYVAGVALMLGIWLVCAVLFGATYFWPVWPILGWGIGVLSHVAPVRRQLAGSLSPMPRVSR